MVYEQIEIGLQQYHYCVQYRYAGQLQDKLQRGRINEGLPTSHLAANNAPTWARARGSLRSADARRMKEFP